MKTNVILIAIVLIAGGAYSSGQSPPPGQAPTALTIIVDTSWSCDRYETTFRSLARQAAATLRPGDYLEILAARPNSPAIKLATTIKTGSAEEIKSIDGVLATIHAQFLSTASIANALEVAFARLNEVSSKRGIAGVTAIVFTRCEISSEEAMRILALADKFNARNWSLYLTGTRNTNRDILVGANRHTLRWCSISEANPALWLAKNEPEGPSAKKKEEPTPELKPPEQLSVPSPIETRTTPDKPQDPLAGQRRVPTSQGGGLSVTTRVDAITSFGPLPGLPDNEAGAPPDGPVAEPNKPSKPVVVPPEPEPPRKEVAGSGHSFWARLKGAFYTYWWLIPLAAVLGGLVIVISKDMVKAGRWDTRKKGHLASASRDPKRLVLRYGDYSRELGRVDRFRSIHIGPGKQNTIRTPGSTAGERHLKLYRRGSDVMLKNLATSSVLANGIEVKPKCKQRLVVPSVIQLNDKTKLNLDFVRPDAGAAQTERNGSHERQPEPQLVG